MRIYSEPQRHGAYHAKLQSGYGLLALVGDIDISDEPMRHRQDWRPAPTEDVPWKAEIIDAKWTRYREGRQ